MKIGVLTFPLNYNYGNLLQAYVLLDYLKREGHDVELINYPVSKKSCKEAVKTYAKVFLKVFFEKYSLKNYPWFYLHEGFDKFIAKMILPKTKPLSDERELKIIAHQNGYNVIIVGSDQVWRKDYIREKLHLYFLSFVPDNVKKIAFSASFGVEEWQFNKEETAEISLLLNRFKNVSVREKNAVKLCKEKLNLDVKHIVDPAFLLTVSDYLELIKTNKTTTPKNFVFTYLLNKNEYLGKIVEEVLKIQNITDEISFSLNDIKHNSVNIKTNEPVFYWLNCIYKSKFIVTNSFHGTVFAILFNKPFIVVSNRSRGMARLKSILGCFDLEERLMEENSEDILTEKISVLSKTDIDWNFINDVIKAERKEAIRFINESIR